MAVYTSANRQRHRVIVAAVGALLVGRLLGVLEDDFGAVSTAGA